MALNHRYAVGGLLVAAGALASALAYPEMPAEMATHWNPQGEVDDTMPRAVGLALLPALGALLLVLFAFLPRVDPLGANVREFRAAYEWTAVGVVAFLEYVHVLVLLWNLDYAVPIGQALVPALVALTFGLGALLERAERNWFVGIRTPWTLSDERVWDRTHERAGRLLKLLAPVGLVGLVAPSYGTLVAVAPLLAVVAYALVFSYREYRRVGAA